VERYANPKPGEPFSITVQKRGDKYDMDLSGTSGPLMRVRGFKMIEHGPLPPGDRFEAPEGGWPSTGVDEVTAHAHTDQGPRAWLREDELTALSARGTPKRIADRIAGRVAAKQALSRLTGVPPHAIRIPQAASGEPIAEVPGWPDVRVSLSHREGTAVAVAVRTGRVGVDLEAIGPRPESFVEHWFSVDERRVASGDAMTLTLMWAIKEAVLKALGTGMALRPQDVQVAEVGEGSARIQLRGDVLARHIFLGGGNLVVRWVRNAFNEVEVVARMAA
jgi:phosphopantetheinyl transferase